MPVMERIYLTVYHTLEAHLYIRCLSNFTIYREETYDAVGLFASGLMSLPFAWIISSADNLSAINEVL